MLVPVPRGSNNGEELFLVDIGDQPDQHIRHGWRWVTNLVGGYFTCQLVHVNKFDMLLFQAHVTCWRREVVQALRENFSSHIIVTLFPYWFCGPCIPSILCPETRNDIQVNSHLFRIHASASFVMEVLWVRDYILRTLPAFWQLKRRDR